MAEQWDQKSWSCIDSQEAESEWEVGLNYTSSRPAPSDHFRQQASYLKGSTRTSQPAPGHQVFRYMSLWGVFHKGVVKSNGLSVLLQFILQLGNPGIGYILLICLFLTIQYIVEELLRDVFSQKSFLHKVQLSINAGNVKNHHHQCKAYLGVRWALGEARLVPSCSSGLCQMRGLIKAGGWYSGDLHAHRVSFSPVFQQYPSPPIVKK